MALTDREIQHMKKCRDAGEFQVPHPRGELLRLTFVAFIMIFLEIPCQLGKYAWSSTELFTCNA